MSGLIKGIFGGGSTSAATPVAATPAVMPLPNDANILQARRRAIVETMSRRGRDSTILTSPPGTKLGT